MLDLIVPVYAKTQQTENMAAAALAQLRQNTEVDHRVIVIDNGTDRDRSAIFGGDPYVLLEENRGYAGGVNTGLRLSSAPAIGVGSIDVFVPSGWAGPITRAALSREGIASPRARRIRYEVDTGEWEQPGCAYWGGIFVMPRAVYDTIGGLDEDLFPLRFSDTDYAVRAAKAGFWVGRVKQVVVEHRDPSISTLFMDDTEMASEYERLQEVHGEFDPYAWDAAQWA